MHRQIYDVLRQVAKDQKTITYGKLCAEVGLPRGEMYERFVIPDYLEVISRLEHLQKRPMLSAVVVSKERERRSLVALGIPKPGQGFFTLAKELERYYGNDDQFYIDELNRVYDYWRDKNLSETGPYWWSNDPTEKFWVEVCQGPYIGRELHCPVRNQQGKPDPWYELLDAVEPDDIIYHWHTADQRFIGYSYTVERVRIENDERHLLLRNFTQLDIIIDLNALEAKSGAIQRAADKIRGQLQGAVEYLPFDFSEGHLHMTSTYFAKLPRSLVPVLFGAMPG